MKLGISTLACNGWTLEKSLEVCRQNAPAPWKYAWDCIPGLSWTWRKRNTAASPAPLRKRRGGIRSGDQRRGPGR